MVPSISEADLHLPTLQLLAQAPGGFMTTAQLTIELAELFKPEGKDAEIIDGRADTYFSQKVRNLVSHRINSDSLFSRGLARYHKDGEGIEITELGFQYIKGS